MKRICYLCAAALLSTLTACSNARPYWPEGAAEEWFEAMKRCDLAAAAEVATPRTNDCMQKMVAAGMKDKVCNLFATTGPLEGIKVSEAPDLDYPGEAEPVPCRIIHVRRKGKKNVQDLTVVRLGWRWYVDVDNCGK